MSAKMVSFSKHIHHVTTVWPQNSQIVSNSYSSMHVGGLKKHTCVIGNFNYSQNWKFPWTWIMDGIRGKGFQYVKAWSREQRYWLAPHCNNMTSTLEHYFTKEWNLKIYFAILCIVLRGFVIYIQYIIMIWPHSEMISIYFAKHILLFNVGKGNNIYISSNKG